MTHDDTEFNVYLTLTKSAPNAGKRWSKEEVEYLKKAVERGDSLDRICDLLGRPWSGVLGKLQDIRYVRWFGRSFTYAWNERKVRRKDPIPRSREKQVPIKMRQINKLIRICRDIAGQSQ
jgi:hypothetical protein